MCGLSQNSLKIKVGLVWMCVLCVRVGVRVVCVRFSVGGVLVCGVAR